MAKLSMIARDKVRTRKSERAKKNQTRIALKKIIKSVSAGYDEKIKAVHELNKRPRDESAVRVRSRCAICGRPRAVYRKFHLCRIHLREAAMRGDVPGLVKSSW